MQPSDSSENCRIIADSAQFLLAPGRLEKVRALRYSRPGIDRRDWQLAAELGWLGMLVSEENGGSGFGLQELCSLAEVLGKSLEPSPLLHAICLVPELPDELRDEVFSGASVVVPAWQERRGDLGEFAPSTVMSRGRLSGQKLYIPMASAADRLVVSTSSGMAVVRGGALGMDLTESGLQDGTHMATANFVDVEAIEISREFGPTREKITLALAAYLLGVMRRAFAITREYLTTRKQFGKQIGSFQALQHRAVDLYVQIELSAAAVRKAALVMDSSHSVNEAALAVSRAKARCSDAAMLVARQGVQLHGGIGYADAADIGLYLRKAMVHANFHGSSAQHRARYRQKSGSLETTRDS